MKNKWRHLWGDFEVWFFSTGIIVLTVFLLIKLLMVIAR